MTFRFDPFSRLKMRAGLLAVALLFFGGMELESHADAPAAEFPPHGTSPWLPRAGFEQWLGANLAKKPYYIKAAEGRLHDGVSEWRVEWTPSPEGVEWYWYWWYGSNGSEYLQHVQSLVGGPGFDQIWLQSFVDEHGIRKYQSIFLKIIHPPGKPSPPVDLAVPVSGAP
jgi:hypothetical protein